MKKFFLTGMLVVFSVNTWADTPQISVVKSIYKEAKRSDDDTAILSRYADSSLRTALRQAAQYEEQTGMICLEASPIWNSQDPNKHAKITFTNAGTNKVKVNIAKQGSVIYSLNCTGSNCRVNDVVSNGYSLKRTIAECN